MHLVRALGPAEARRLTNEVKRDAQTLWVKLIELYEAGAHDVLGYESWHSYCAQEFGFGRSRSYRLLEAGRVHAVIPQLGNESQARELARRGDEAEVVEVWHELADEYGVENITAALVREAVEPKLRPTASALRAVPEGVVEIDQLEQAKEVLSSAYTKAAGLIADYLERTGEEPEAVCRQVAPLDWQGLVMRLEQDR